MVDDFRGWGRLVQQVAVCEADKECFINAELKSSHSAFTRLSDELGIARKEEGRIIDALENRIPTLITAPSGEGKTVLSHRVAAHFLRQEDWLVLKAGVSWATVGASGDEQEEMPWTQPGIKLLLVVDDIGQRNLSEIQRLVKRANEKADDNNPISILVTARTFESSRLIWPENYNPFSRATHENMGGTIALSKLDAEKASQFFRLWKSVQPTGAGEFLSEADVVRQLTRTEGQLLPTLLQVVSGKPLEDIVLGMYESIKNPTGNSYQPKKLRNVVDLSVLVGSGQTNIGNVGWVAGLMPAAFDLSEDEISEISACLKGEFGQFMNSSLYRFGIRHPSFADIILKNCEEGSVAQHTLPSLLNAIKDQHVARFRVTNVGRERSEFLEERKLIILYNAAIKDLWRFCYDRPGDDERLRSYYRDLTVVCPQVSNLWVHMQAQFEIACNNLGSWPDDEDDTILEYGARQIYSDSIRNLEERGAKQEEIQQLITYWATSEAKALCKSLEKDPHAHLDERVLELVMRPLGFRYGLKPGDKEHYYCEVAKLQELQGVLSGETGAIQLYMEAFRQELKDRYTNHKCVAYILICFEKHEGLLKLPDSRKVVKELLERLHEKTFAHVANSVVNKFQKLLVKHFPDSTMRERLSETILNEYDKTKSLAWRELALKVHQDAANYNAAWDILKSSYFKGIKHSMYFKWLFDLLSLDQALRVSEKLWILNVIDERGNANNYLNCMKRASELYPCSQLRDMMLAKHERGEMTAAKASAIQYLVIKLEDRDDQATRQRQMEFFQQYCRGLSAPNDNSTSLYIAWLRYLVLQARISNDMEPWYCVAMMSVIAEYSKLTQGQMNSKFKEIVTTIKFQLDTIKAENDTALREDMNRLHNLTCEATAETI